jgi:hypothetical protein
VYYDFLRAGSGVPAEAAVHDILQLGVQERNDMAPDFWRSVGSLKAASRRNSESSHAAFEHCEPIAITPRRNRSDVTITVMAKALFREQLRDYAATERHKDFDSLSNSERSKLMARFFAEKVLKLTNPNIIPATEEEMDAAVTDGSDDCNVDFICRQTGTVVILQAKFSGHKKTGNRQPEPNDHFEAFRSVLNRLYLGPKKIKMNRRLKEAVVDIDWENDTFQLYYITLFQPGDNARSQAENGIAELTDLADLPDRSSIELLDEEQLNVRLRDAINLAADVSKPVSILFSSSQGGPPWLEYKDPESGRTAYLGRINGSQIAEIFKAHQSTIFSLNIRNYIGDNITNREIRKTATGDPHSFFFYNNGVSALAKKIKLDIEHRTLTCEGFSVVNGAQTVRSLSKAWADDTVSVRDVELLIRISEFGSLTTGEQEFLANVTRFNNTQNSIKLSDFRSNDAIQIDLKKKFAMLTARAGRKFLYKNKRSEKDAKYIAVGMEDFVKTVFAFNHGPDDVYGGTQYLFDTSKSGGYMKLFGSDGDLLPALSNEVFAEYAGAWFACEYIREVWQREPETEALERRWMVFFAVGEAIRIVYRRSGRTVAEALNKLCDPKWFAEGEETHRKVVLRVHCKHAFKALRDVYAKEKEIKGEDFRHRNWFRSDKTLTAVGEQLNDLLLLYDDEEMQRFRF